MPLEAPDTPPRPRGDPAFANRIWSALVLGLVALLAGWFGGWVFAGLVAVTSILMLREWVRISDPAAPARAWLPVGLVVAAAVLLAAAERWAPGLFILAAAAVAAAIQRWLRGHQWRAAFGAIYVGVPCVALVWVREVPDAGYAALLYLFAVVWSADVGAYLCGKFIGGTKLAPRISPNKTWTGLGGGLGCGAAAGAAGFLLLGQPVFIGGALGLALAAAAMAGDLLESLLKRRFGVKDAGRMIPGHGGVLDRVDALMGAVLMFAALVWFWPAAGGPFFTE